jgi:DNA-binding NtrC family response regulator
MHKGKILVADDEPLLVDSIQMALTAAGYHVVSCTKGSNFIPLLVQQRPDLVLLDVYLGEHNGVRLLRQMMEEGWKTPVVMMTAHADVPIAVEATKLGAVEFLIKPFDLAHLQLTIDRALEHLRLKSKVTLLQSELEDQRTRSGIVGASPKLQAVLDTAGKLAYGDTTVLLEGESGSGKELMGRFIHQKSPRADKPFITLNCGAIPRDLAESEFFGYEKGAFTGATEKMKQGKFELADGGTILLDEVGELSLDMQVKLLRVLEEKKFYRLGGTREVSVDVRILAATNRNLAKEVEAGRFREDLYYRLHVASIMVPALRERPEDIAPLTLAFLQDVARKLNRPVPGIQDEALRFLASAAWKGNVRELKNAVERAVLLSDSPVLGPQDFAFLPAASRVPGGVDAAAGRYALQIPREGIAMKEVLRDLILKTLNITNGNQVRAAKILGVTRSKLRYRMELLDIAAAERTFHIAGPTA